MTQFRELAFIDSGIADVATLIAGLRPGVMPIVLDPAKAALPQMADLLAGCGELDAVHIVAHGRPGEVSFTGGAVTAEAIALYAEELSAIGAALAERGTINLWSCLTGEGASGRSFVAALSRALGAEVAASSHLVGAVAKGGSWELDSVFAVRAPLTAAGIAVYSGVMATNTGGGTTASFSNTPQAEDDVFLTNEDVNAVLYLNVMGNDLSGNAKSLWSLDDGTSASTATKIYAPADLLTQDTVRVEATSTDYSANHAHIWITSDGKVGYG